MQAMICKGSCKVFPSSEAVCMDRKSIVNIGFRTILGFRAFTGGLGMYFLWMKRWLLYMHYLECLGFKLGFGELKFFRAHNHVS